MMFLKSYIKINEEQILIKSLFLCLISVIFITSALPASEDKRGIDHVIIYPAYGYYDDGDWVIPLRIYSYEYRERGERIFSGMVNFRRDLETEQSEIFQSRIRYFVADSESGEEVKFVFDDDPEGTIFKVKDKDGNHLSTNRNGEIEGEIRISDELVNTILENNQSEENWLSLSVVSDGHIGGGKVRLIEQEGLSVISDIDDTIKITQIPAGPRVVIRNTFYKEYSPAPRMADLYNSWENASFHYVSGSPWQLYPALSEFMFDEDVDFPEGTFHLKSVTKNLFSRSTWSDLREVTMNDDVTYEQKLRQITQIFEHFPQRQFILIGDSGERDPEIFSAIREQFSEQIKEIIIRDVVNARELEPERLENMRVIPAPTIFRRSEISQDN